MRYFFSILFFLQLASGIAQVPEFSCVSVNNSNVILQWTNPVGSTSSDKIQIFFRSDDPTGNYSQVVELNGDITLWQHSGINPDQNDLYYYLTYNNSTLTSDTLNTILPELQSNLNGEVTLLWNAFLGDKMQSGQSHYTVYRRLDNMSWNLVAQTDDLHYEDKVCDHYVEYQVQVEDVLTCTSVSVVVGQPVNDDTAPDANFPKINFLTVNENGNITIDWEPSPDDDVDRYVIAHQIIENGVWKNHPFDSVNVHTHTFTDSIYDGCKIQRRYFVYAVDVCGNRSPINFTNEPLKNILLDEVIYDTCAREAHLNWLPYNNPSNPITQYEIWLGQDGDQLMPIAIVDAFETNYIAENIDWYHDYCFQIRGVFHDGYTGSCTQCMTGYKPVVFQNCYVHSTDATNKDYIEVYISYQSGNDINHIAVLRSDAEFGVYEEIGIFPTETGGKLVFTDADVDQSRQWFYKAELRDMCNDVVWPSFSANNIVLEGSVDEEFYTINWEPYLNSKQNISSYSLYQIINGMAVEQETYFPDIVTDRFIPKDTPEVFDFSFYIEANVDGMIPFDQSNFPKSNIISFSKESKISFPNTLIPGSPYGEFKPVVEAVRTQGYTMSIYNRWGTMVFESDDPNVGWDGTYNGDYVQTGAYVYSVSYIDHNGSTEHLQGTLTVIR
ncbi:MAG: gliding motility-associated C-terminal domain-containing protein [Bacteroidales bacterium]|nr:gliding motility-associated C-terminal domain-containing protein [Bacteroidales bacterium]